MLDVWGRPSEAFWGSVLPIVDPVNAQAGVDGPDVKPARGGAWPFTILTNRAAFRLKRGMTELRSDTGFRCARR
jgi:formylglycine-generating enzyme required for sulfatase activity